MTETLHIPASDIRAGDTLKGWNGYIVVRFEPHADGVQGRIHLRDTRPTTSPYCWTPKRSDETVTVTR